MRPKRGAIGETWNAIADCCDRSHRARAAVAPETDCGGARSVGAIGKESGAAASSYAGGVRILHSADHLGLMEFQQQKVSSRCRGRDRSIERVKAKGPHGKR